VLPYRVVPQVTDIRCDKLFVLKRIVIDPAKASAAQGEVRLMCGLLRRPCASRTRCCAALPLLPAIPRAMAALNYILLILNRAPTRAGCWVGVRR
jgi:hypothetical protein